MKTIIIYLLTSMFLPITITNAQLSSGVDTAWVKHYATGLLSSDNIPRAMVIDESGNIYVTGGSDGLGTSFDYTTIKYDTSGVELWVARYDGLSNGPDMATSLAVDSYGNVYVTGSSEGIGTGNDYATIKYNSDGIEQWVIRFNGSGNGKDEATAIAVDGSGNVYVTGTSEGTGTGDDYATIKYNASGIEQWVARYNGPGNSGDFANALALDSLGNVYVSGTSIISYGDRDFITIKYNNDGIEQWVVRYDGQDNGWDAVADLAVDDQGNVYVTGESSIWWSTVFTTIKYTEIGTPVQDHELSKLPKEFSLTQNYPNPFNPSTRIKFTLPKSEIVKIEVYNTLGQKIETLLNKAMKAGQHELEFNGSHLSSGIYFYRIQAREYQDVKKMILLK